MVEYDTDLAGKRRRLKEHINELLSKGYSKKEVKERLMNGGYSWIVVNRHLYPYFSVLVVAGLILIAMILIIGAFAGFSLFSGNSSTPDEGGENSGSTIVDDTGNKNLAEEPLGEVDVRIPESACRRFLDNPERYEGRDDYDTYVEQCGELDLTVFDCSTIEDLTWQQRCEEEVAEEGYFRSEETWKKVVGG